jgi:hypothetical protein
MARLLNTTQSAEYLGIKYDAFAKYVRPKLHPVALTAKRKLYDVRELDALIENNKLESLEECQQTNSPKPASLVSIPETAPITCASNTSVYRFRDLLESK